MHVMSPFVVGTFALALAWGWVTPADCRDQAAVEEQKDA